MQNVCVEIQQKNAPKEHETTFGGRDGTRTHNPVKEADFKSAAYTNSATRPSVRLINYI